MTSNLARIWHGDGVSWGDQRTPAATVEGTARPSAMYGGSCPGATRRGTPTRATRQTVTAPTTFATKAPAVAWLRREAVRLESEAAGAPKVVSKPKITLSEYGARWLAERDLRPTTRRTYGGLWKVIDSDLGSRRIADLTAPEIAEWHRGALPGRPAARANAYGLLRVILNAAVDEGLIEANPCRVRGGAASRRERQIPVVSPEQITALKDAMPSRFAAMVTLAAWAGLRFGEIAEKGAGRCRSRRPSVPRSPAHRPDHGRAGGRHDRRARPPGRALLARCGRDLSARRRGARP